MIIIKQWGHVYTCSSSTQQYDQVLFKGVQVTRVCEVLTTVFTRETKMTSSHESFQIFSCCELLTTVFTREMKMTSSHEYLQTFSYCEALVTVFTRETKMTSPHDSLQVTETERRLSPSLSSQIFKYVLAFFFGKMANLCCKSRIDYYLI